MTAVNFLLIAVLAFLLFQLIPSPEPCWVPVGADPAYFDADCWDFWEVWL